MLNWTHWMCVLFKGCAVFLDTWKSILGNIILSLKNPTKTQNPQKSKYTVLINWKGLKGRAEPTPFTPLNSSHPVERGEEKEEEILLGWIIRILHFISRCKTEVGDYFINMSSEDHHLRSKMAFFSCLLQFATDAHVLFSSYLSPNPWSAL